jgi:hypothetical protein
LTDVTLLDGEAEALTRKAIELALGGDSIALRAHPTAKARTSAEIRVAGATVFDRCRRCRGRDFGRRGIRECLRGRGGELAKLVDAFIRAVEAAEKAELQESENSPFSTLGLGGLLNR